MAKQGSKTEMLKCIVTDKSVTFQHVKRAGDDWEVFEEMEVQCASVPDVLVDGDGFASMKAYGIRAFLSDRTSQFREYGIKHTMQEMQQVAAMLQNGVYRAKRKASAVSDLDLLAQAIAAIKGLSLEVAKASVKALDKERQDKLRSQPAVAAKMAELRSAVAEAETVELDDLFGEDA